MALFNPSESPNYRFTVPELPSQNMRALLAYVEALNAWNYDAIMDSFDDALEHRILPRSLGRPVLNKRQYGEYFKNIMPLLKGFTITLHEVIESDDKMTVHASSVGKSTFGLPYANEYTLIIQFVPPPPGSGPSTLPRMRFVKEFVDSGFSIKFFTETRAKVKELEVAKENA